MSSQPQKRKFQQHFGDQKWKDKKQRTNDGTAREGGGGGHREGGSRLLNKLDAAKNRPKQDESDDESTEKKPRTITNDKGEEIVILKKSYEQVLKELPEDDKKQRKIAQQVLKNAMREKDHKHYNRLILDMGNTRGLYGYAKQAYQDMLSLNLKPNEYTFANLINAAARASEPADMETFLADMKKWNIPYDLVIYTAIMKLHTTMGNCKEAINTLKQMCDEDGITPNIRTYHTVLRQCCQDNLVPESEFVYNHLLAQYKQQKSQHYGGDDDGDKNSGELLSLRPSPTIYQSMCSLYAINFNLTKAEEFFNLLHTQYQTATGDSEDDRGDLVMLPFALVHCGISLASAAIPLNELTLARKYITLSREIMDKIMSNPTIQWWKFKKVSGKEKDRQKELKKHQDGKKWHERENADAAAEGAVDPADDRVAFEHDSNFTQEQFLKQRAHEFHHDLHKLQAYINKTAHLQNITPGTLSFSEAMDDYPWRPKAKGLVENQGFGWGQRVIRVDKYIQYNKEGSKGAKDLRKFKADVCSLNDDMIDWHKVFDNDNTEVIIEVGSGTGEWIVNKCLQHPTINFVACEVSPVRINQIYTRMALEGLKNLVIVQGDAFVLLEELVAPKSVHQIYVNFPQPPWFSAWRYRLLNTKFFTLCHQALVKSKLVVDAKDQDVTDDRYGLNGQGFVTIVTDDGSYVYLLLRELFHENGKSKDLFMSMLTNVDDGKSVQFSTELPPLFGSSYYHRFWQKGQKFRRFYLKLAKNNNLSQVEVQNRYQASLTNKPQGDNKMTDEVKKPNEEEQSKKSDKSDKKEKKSKKSKE